MIKAGNSINRNGFLGVYWLFCTQINLGSKKKLI